MYSFLRKIQKLRYWEKLPKWKFFFFCKTNYSEFRNQFFSNYWNTLALIILWLMLETFFSYAQFRIRKSIFRTFPNFSPFSLPNNSEIFWSGYPFSLDFGCCKRIEFCRKNGDIGSCIWRLKTNVFYDWRYFFICKNELYPKIYNKFTLVFHLAFVWVMGVIIMGPSVIGYDGNGFTYDRRTLLCPRSYMAETGTISPLLPRSAI